MSELEQIQAVLSQVNNILRRIPSQGRGLHPESFSLNPQPIVAPAAPPPPPVSPNMEFTYVSPLDPTDVPQNPGDFDEVFAQIIEELPTP